MGILWDFENFGDYFKVAKNTLKERVSEKINTVCREDFLRLNGNRKPIVLYNNEVGIIGYELASKNFIEK